MKNLDKAQIMLKLAFLDVNLAPRTLQLYAKEKLIPAPTFPNKGQGARAIYRPETLAETYAAYWLLREDRLGYERVREARQIGRYLETTNYNTLKDILDDITIRILILHKPKETFYAFEWLWLKYSVLPDRELAVNSDIRGILIALAEGGDDYIEAMQMMANYREVDSQI